MQLHIVYSGSVVPRLRATELVCYTNFVLMNSTWDHSYSSLVIIQPSKQIVHWTPSSFSPLEQVGVCEFASILYIHRGVTMLPSFCMVLYKARDARYKTKIFTQETKRCFLLFKLSSYYWSYNRVALCSARTVKVSNVVWYLASFVELMCFGYE